MIKGVLIRQRKKMLMIAVTVALGVSLATAVLNVMLDVGDKVNQELKAYGANINVIPRGAFLLNDLYGIDMENGISDKYLDESQIGNIKTIFWSFNIVDFTPYLELSGKANNEKVKIVGTWFNYELKLETGEFRTGMKNLKTWWQVSGAWLEDSDADAVMVGSIYASRNGIKTGDKITLNVADAVREFTVKGVFDSGSSEDEYVYLPLSVVQEMAGLAGKVSRIEVSALTTPDNELALKAAQDIKSLSIKEYETWYCTAYVSSISYQIEEVITDAVAKPIRQIAESEGAILDKTQLLMLLITVLSLAGAAVGITNLVTASVMERSQEIGLLKAVGAKDSAVILLIFTEILITSTVGGIIGYFVGLGFAQIIGQTVFSSAIAIKAMVIPIIAVSVFVITLIGSIPSIKMLLSLKPAEVLHGR
jgi:putative ABC transport system permease protein